MYQVAKNPTGLSDVLASLKSAGLVWLLSWHDVRQRYRRSTIGPFWITISNAILIACIGLVFGKVFGAGTNLVPSLAIGITLWTFVSTAITEGCSSFIAAEGIVKQLPIPLFIHVERVVIRNVFILAHNALVIPVVLLLFDNNWSWVALLSLVGFLLLVINLLWIGLWLAILCARYRDLPQVISNALQVFFYVTPILWPPSLLPEGGWLLDFNPFYHFVEIVRAPLLGHLPEAINWIASIMIALVGWVLTLLFFNRYRRRIPYWL